MKPFIGGGAFAEYVVVGDQLGIAQIPDGLDLATAGGLGLAGTAALDVVAAISPPPGETVLVSGATGGVGAITIQYAVSAGAVAIATAARSRSRVRAGLGATHVVDHTEDLAAQVRAIRPDGVSAAVHLAGDASVVAGLLAVGRRLASTLGFGPDQHPQATAVMASPERETLDGLGGDAASGRLTIPITSTFALSELAQGIAQFPAGTLGKLAVTLT
jgi:NADPH:quinone reductase-like Zn-dependent oxidoreductase